MSNNSNSNSMFSHLRNVLALSVEKCVGLQAFLKLKHDTGVEHIFLVGSTGKEFSIALVSVPD